MVKRSVGIGAEDDLTNRHVEAATNTARATAPNAIPTLTRCERPESVTRRASAVGDGISSASLISTRASPICCNRSFRSFSVHRLTYLMANWFEELKARIPTN